jgi:hypothetical protein
MFDLFQACLDITRPGINKRNSSERIQYVFQSQCSVESSERPSVTKPVPTEGRAMETLATEDITNLHIIPSEANVPAHKQLREAIQPVYREVGQTN